MKIKKTEVEKKDFLSLDECEHKCELAKKFFPIYKVVKYENAIRNTSLYEHIFFYINFIFKILLH